MFIWKRHQNLHRFCSGSPPPSLSPGPEVVYWAISSYRYWASQLPQLQIASLRHNSCHQVADDVSNKRQNISREITVATVFPANLIKQGIPSENYEISLGPAQKTSLVQILSYSYFCLKIPHFSISPISFLLNWVVLSGEQPRRFYSDISAEGLEMSNSALCIDPLYCSSLLSTIRHF